MTLKFRINSNHPKVLPSDHLPKTLLLIVSNSLSYLPMTVTTAFLKYCLCFLNPKDPSLEHLVIAIQPLHIPLLFSTFLVPITIRKLSASVKQSPNRSTTPLKIKLWVAPLSISTTTSCSSIIPIIFVVWFNVLN